MHNDKSKLIEDARIVLARHVPGAGVPDDLTKVRAMLEAHMFNGDECRDGVAELAMKFDDLQ